MRAITRAAGANLGAVSYHFGSKRGLYESVLDSVFAPLRRRLQAASNQGEAALDRVDGVVRGFFRHLAENPDLPHLLLQEIAAGRQPPDAVVTTMRYVVAGLAQIIRDGQRHGFIRPGDPVLMALSVIAQPVHLTLVSRLAVQILGIDQGDPSERQTIVEHAVRFARSGLAAQVEGSS